MASLGTSRLRDPLDWEWQWPKPRTRRTTSHWTGCEPCLRGLGRPIGVPRPVSPETTAGITMMSLQRVKGEVGTSLTCQRWPVIWRMWSLLCLLEGAALTRGRSTSDVSPRLEVIACFVHSISSISDPPGGACFETTLSQPVPGHASGLTFWSSPSSRRPPRLSRGRMGTMH